ncbi:MAG TPA: methionine biosynthesis protein MetW [Thioploca sp.]|nr:MAG: methionine biosynthesis protein MetW [Gammaproteobacteria bacterium]HDN27730.1 methionine biosynthesis protein MetW [Thioploca sp.]
MDLRTDLALISEWIAEGSHVLDLGCGDGTLLAHLRDTCQVTGYGLEIDEDNIALCIQARVNVIQTDLNQGLSDFADDSFDYVVMTQALQSIHRPDLLLMEMLRVGREGIVTFPNFGHWRARSSLLFRGVMPTSRALPSEWYNTENIHLCTVRDFEKLCDTLNIEVLQRTAVDTTHHTSWFMRLVPNLFGEIALYRFRSKPVKRISPSKS